jgi:hypothetical protein
VVVEEGDLVEQQLHLPVELHPRLWRINRRRARAPIKLILMIGKEKKRINLRRWEEIG